MTEHDEVGQVGRSFKGQFMDVVHPSSNMLTGDRPNYATERMSQIINNPIPEFREDQEGITLDVPEPIVASDFVKESYKRSEEKFASIFMPKKEPEPVEMQEEVVEESPVTEEPVVEEFSEIPSAPLQTPFLDNVEVNKRPLSTPVDFGASSEADESVLPVNVNSTDSLESMPPEPAENVQVNFEKQRPVDNYVAEQQVDEVLDMQATAVQDIQNDILSETAVLGEPEAVPQPSQPEVVDRLDRSNAEGKPGENQEVNMSAAIETSMTADQPKIYEDGKLVDVAVIDMETAELKPPKKKHSTLRFVMLLLFLMVAGCAAGALIYIYHPEWLEWLNFDLPFSF